MDRAAEPDDHLYGLVGMTHGGARALTVMSRRGASAVREALVGGPDVIVHSPPGHLTRLLEKRDGALERLIEAHRIRVLPKPRWDRLKAELGDAIYH